jgi:hypothetical protein
MKAISEWTYMTAIHIILHFEGIKRYMFYNSLLLMESNSYQHELVVTSKHPGHTG